jgi:hypothetical protein
MGADDVSKCRAVAPRASSQRFFHGLFRRLAQLSSRLFSITQTGTKMGAIIFGEGLCPAEGQRYNHLGFGLPKPFPERG